MRTRLGHSLCGRVWKEVCGVPPTVELGLLYPQILRAQLSTKHSAYFRLLHLS